MNVTPSSINPTPLSRRTFLELAGKGLLAVSGLLGLGGLSRFFSFQTETAVPQTFALGPAENYPPGSRTFISQAQAYILHTDEGITAVSAICPHLGCSVNLADNSFDCPCHGSRFALDGEKLQGPANRSLRDLSVEISADNQLTLLT